MEPDKLEITGLRVKTQIGVHEWEQAIRQTLSIDLIIDTDFENLDDRIELALDYDMICQDIHALLNVQSFRLIETVALSIYERLRQILKFKSITIRVSKPHAIKGAQNISVRMTRDF